MIEVIKAEDIPNLGDYDIEVYNAIIVPRGATNGDVIKSMFPNIEANEIKTNTGGYIAVKYLDTTDVCDATAFRKNWWNAPYKRDNEMSKCTDCNEYNQEKHYCPKFCDVIRDTTKEIQEFYKGEHEKLERIEWTVNDYGLSETDLTNEDLSDFERDILREILEKE